MADEKLYGEVRSPASQLMAIEVMSELLVSTSPQKLGETLTEHLRELTGARTAIILIGSGGHEGLELLNISPPRRATLFSAAELAYFHPRHCPGELPTLPERLPADHPLREPLVRGEVRSMLRYPLQAVGETVGFLILLDIPGLDRVAELNQIITLLAPPIALALKNALAFRMIEQHAQVLEQRVAERTAELIRNNLALQQSEGKFRSYVDSSPDGIFVADEDGRYLEVNRAACSMTGYGETELLGMSLPQLLPPAYAKAADRHFRALKETGAASCELEFVRKDGSKRWWFVDAVRLSDRRYLGFTKDITERKQAEEERIKLEQQLLHSQKLESLGVLAGGIAHDFNNILTAIIGNADLALMRLSSESPALDNLRNIEKAAARAADLAKQMLAYSGKGKFVIEPIYLNRMLEEMVHMLEVSISKKAVLRFNLAPTLPLVEADATQMHQIIMNLVINASEAIGEKSGIIAITTGCMDCDRKYLDGVWLAENISEGLYVYLEIADTGCGMDKKTLAKVFDPFFTTKFTGRGLGMAAVLGIIRGHKGAIKIYSEYGKGTTFKILLPASGRPAELFSREWQTQDQWRGCGVALIVDDEETVRAIGGEMLRELGYSVVTASDGREALEVFNGRDDICLVILDLTMPRLDGEQTFRELRRIDPGIKVIMSSGYNEQEVAQRFVGKGLSGFVQKPYNLSTLREVIKSCR